jgi:hypothetical protein
MVLSNEIDVFKEVRGISHLVVLLHHAVASAKVVGRFWYEVGGAMGLLLRLPGMVVSRHWRVVGYHVGRRHRRLTPPVVPVVLLARVVVLPAPIPRVGALTAWLRFRNLRQSVTLVAI